MKSGIIYNGPSLLDGKPIVVIATFSNRNTKTGAVVQTYIFAVRYQPAGSKQDGRRLFYLWLLHHARRSNDGPQAQACKGPSLLCQTISRAVDCLEVLQGRAISTRQCNGHGPGPFRKAWNIRGPGSSAPICLEQSIKRSTDLDSIHTPTRENVRDLYAVSGHLPGSERPLGRWSSNLPSDQRSIGPRQSKRNTLPGLQRSRSPGPMHSLQALQGI